VALAGSDRSPEAVAAARRSAQLALGAHAADITWSVADARTLAPLDPPGDVICNPPYGERMGGQGGGSGLESFYRAFGQRLRTLVDHRAFVLAPRDCQRWLGLRPSLATPLKNGPLDVDLCRYDLRRSARIDAARG
jgi:23S rRNA G2445 N2-methylase RlmL